MAKLLALPLLLLALMSSPTSQAGTPITDQMAEKYFENCISGAQKEGTMGPESQKKYCACTAVKMKDTMDQEDLSLLSNVGDKARPALNKVLLNVNGPCMQYPVHDLLNKKCMSDVKNPAICSCLSNKMADFMKDISGRMLPKILADNPTIFDPITPIMESEEFQKTQQQVALSCATNPNGQ